MSTLPELNRALRMLSHTCVIRCIPNTDDIAEIEPDEFGVVDLMPFSDVAFTKKVMRWGDFAALAEFPSYRVSMHRFLVNTTFLLRIDACSRDSAVTTTSIRPSR